MTDEKNTTVSTDNSAGKQNEADENLPVHNPLKKDDDKEITQRDVENEQLFKEAQTERD